MDSTSRNMIRKEKDTIKSLDLEKIKPYLEKSKIFTRSMLSDIYDKDSKCDLVSELPTRGPTAFLDFLRVLEDSGYSKEVLKIKNASQSKSNKKLAFYPMKSKPLGYCLLINNIEFTNLEERIGSDIDARGLKNLFEKLDFTVQEETNLRGKDMLMCMKSLSENLVLKTIDCFFLIILSHGERGEIIYGTDKYELKKSTIYKTFNNRRCPFLKKKPKIFLFQACRGNKEDPGVESTDSTDSLSIKMPINETPVLESVDFNMNEEISLPTESSDSSYGAEKLPVLSDMLIVHSSLPNHKAYREHGKGSWLIQDIISVFSSNYLEQDLETMLKNVYAKCQKRLSQKSGSKQAPHSENIGFHACLHLCNNKDYEGCDASSRNYI